jgi:transketolase
MENEIRKLIITAAYKAGHGHIPSALSIVEIITSVHSIMTENDVFILSKGHGCLAYYAYLCHCGIISIDELNNFGNILN